MQEYGLRCILQVAAHKATSPLTVRDIAKREGLTHVYVAKILVTLRRANLVKSLRGVNGGYILSRPATSISVADVLGALGRLDMGHNHCRRFPGTQDQCTHIGNCGIRPVLGVLSQYVYGFLSKLNLEHLLREESIVTQDVNELQAKLPPPIVRFPA